MWLSLATLAVSLPAIAASGLLTLRQIRLATSGVHLPVVLNAFRETRTEAWLVAEQFVLTEGS